MTKSLAHVCFLLRLVFPVAPVQTPGLQLKAAAALRQCFQHIDDLTTRHEAARLGRDAEREGDEIRQLGQNRNEALESLPQLGMRLW